MHVRPHDSRGSATVRLDVLAALEDAGNDLPMALRDTIGFVLDTRAATVAG